ncbi:hypothetical protein [Sphingomonas sp. 37zxx]|uniref:hypothetical protein n=1 Tax=Sphingomonas sp. 37zxx TaxID=1550073 RepID=UPI00069162D4|nr:hypothetical protein [Sphingomonas sp. 37zxx]
MILALDSSALALLINPDARAPDDPDTGEPVTNARERVVGLIAGMSAADTLIVPTPVLAELLVRAGKGGPAVLEQLQGQARVRLCPFDVRAAIEVALMTQEALESGDKRGGSGQPWQKVKYDRQIIAVARVAAAKRLYSDDRGLAAFARLVGMDVVSTWELPVPEGTDNLFTSAGLPPDGQPSRPTE